MTERERGIIELRIIKFNYFLLNLKINKTLCNMYVYLNFQFQFENSTHDWMSFERNV